MIRPLKLVLALAATLFMGAALAQQGELRIGMQYDHGSFDPQLLTLVTDQQMAVNMFNGLVRYELGALEIEPDLATSWEMSEDGRTWTFQLRQGVQFHKGYGELTAEDVQFTFDRLVDPEFASPNAALMSAIAEVEVVGPYEVRFNLSEPDPAFLDKLANSFSKIVSRRAVEERGNAFGDDPIGTGRFQFASWTPDQETVLEAFPDYYEGPAALARVVYVPVPDPTTMYSAFEAGDLDMIQVTDPIRLQRYENSDAFGVAAVPGLITRFMGMNTTVEPLNDPLVREAITYAINRDDMIRYVFSGISTAAEGILAPDVQHSATGAVQYSYDPERARELLAEAGYEGGISLTLSTPNIDRFTLPATVIQSDLAAVGIDVSLEVMESQAFIALLQSEDTPDLFILSRGQDATPDRVLYTWHHSSEVPTNNWARVEDPEVDAWLEAATTSVDVDERDRLFRLVQERVADGDYYYYIDHENMIFAYSSRVQGFVVDAQRSLRLDRVSVGTE